MIEMNPMILIVVLPIITIILSMCAYIGKILVIKLFFKIKKGDIYNGKKEK